jgi:putative membrane protein
MRVRLLATFAVLACLVLGAAWAQQQEQQPVDQPRAGTDQNWISTNLEHCMLGAKLAQLGAERATNPEVKRFARKLADEHAQANRELINLANQNRVQVPREMTKEHQQIWQRIANLRGAEFDREFLQQVIKDHREAITTFEDKAQNAENAQVKEFAGKMLPTLKEHLKMAQDLAGKLGQGEQRDREGEQRDRE